MAPDTKQVDSAYDIILDDAKKELQRLLGDVKRQEAVIATLEQMRRRRAVGSNSTAQLLIGAVIPESGTMPERIDAILSAHHGEKFTPKRLVDLLGGRNGKFSGTKTRADVLVRSTLRRCSERYAWKVSKRGRITNWWKEAVGS